MQSVAIATATRDQEGGEEEKGDVNYQEKVDI